MKLLGFEASLIIVLFFGRVLSLPAVIRIGGLFGEGEEEEEAIFRFAIERINDDKNILPSSTLVAQVERVPNADSYAVYGKVCKLARDGLAAIIGPASDITSLTVRSVCDALEIPHIEMQPDIESRHDALSINLYPRPEKMAKAYLDIVNGLGWESFAIAYENNEGVALYQEFFKLLNYKNWELKLYQFNADVPYRDVFWKIKMSGQKNIILDVRQEYLKEALKQV